MQSKKSNTEKRGVIIALSIALLLSTLGQATLAAGDGSVDSMWMDDGDKEPAKSEAATTGNQEAAAPSEPPAQRSIEKFAAAEDTAAPMCTLDTFKESAIVSKGGWPGVGPFKADNEFDFLDEHQNKLHVDVTGQQITRAEMALSSRPLSGDVDKDLLDMQMNIDFFLEAVGIKPLKIQELNAELSKSKGALLRADDAPLNFHAGRCSVSIDKKRSLDGGKVDYVIAVNSLDANQQIIRQHSVSETRRNPLSTLAPEETKPILPIRSIVKPAPTRTTVSSSDAPLKEQFAELINGWQRIKKGAVRNRLTEELGLVLAGRALVRQTDAIKWLLTNKKYYDMNPKGVIVDQYAELSPAKKYMVSAQVREAYKFIDEPTGKVLKDVDDVNKVNYTVEKIAGKWVITDSALLAAPTKAPIKASTNKSTR